MNKQTRVCWYILGRKDGELMKEITVLGVRLSVTSKEEIRRAVKAAVDNRQKLAMVAVNARKIVRAVEHEETRRLLDTFDVFLADGAAVVKAAQEPVERITGVDLMEDLCAHAADLGLSIFLYGALLSNNLKAQEVLRSRYPDIRIVGHCSGYEDDDVVEQINASQANIVFVAKGTPAQERWIAENKEKTCANVYLGVGGAFDILSGSLVRAPRWIQNLGFEWLFRMVLEPRRFSQLPELFRFERMIRKERKKRQVNENESREERNQCSWTGVYRSADGGGPRSGGPSGQGIRRQSERAGKPE